MAVAQARCAHPPAFRRRGNLKQSAACGKLWSTKDRTEKQVNKRFIALGAILASGPLILAFAWPLVAEKVRIADLKLAVVTQPRSEIIVSGYLKNHESPAFSLESLSIEEPGHEPFRRQVSLDANRSFELALGRPVAGTYRIAAWTRKADWFQGVHEGWLRVPDLVVKPGSPPGPQKVRAQDFDYQRLFLFGLPIVAVQAALLIAWFRLPAPPAQAPAAD